MFFMDLVAECLWPNGKELIPFIIWLNVIIYHLRYVDGIVLKRRNSGAAD